jgi:hypothetical protein
VDLAKTLSGLLGFKFSGALLDERHNLVDHLPVCGSACGLEPDMHTLRQVDAETAGFLDFYYLCGFPSFHICGNVGSCVLTDTTTLKRADLVGCRWPPDRCEVLLGH